ncbi:uncharacterized protein MONBRDRAFT_13409 [Monosiga brevicollis MX1]|uniref:3-beta hydroxysteroid dehydrogenase/isomerase domain-containing protein n=1 Tax=Monosiga brevicollis TaxID=81824 RepID=A9UQT0_MONBE|nr:uncharacterized protein MONBRDRAFT_13409 [Monosiga brevicollis MX1]EDQ92651.1 predicted protein [Monosiga brevicollis MX1]|eukprot:XP_001742413.1 hypothetical protein [Monosiga brevicollis MX1]
MQVSPFASAEQRRAALAYKGDSVPAHCCVTGGTGFVGQRLVEMLLERGAKRVVSFDIVPPPKAHWEHPNVEYVIGDICDVEALERAFKGADCVWHNAAAVGPFHPHELYDKVNRQGTLNVIEVCRKLGIPKIVMSSSPSTRFDGSDINGLSEAEMPKLPMATYLQAYAQSKAEGEMALTAACCDELMTVAVAPHQVYGPRDNLFVPNMLEAAGKNLLRVFSSARTGYGQNRVCFTYVDNYAHGLIIAEKALYKGSPALGKFYVVTDGSTHPHPEGYALFWPTMDKMITSIGFTSIYTRWKLSTWFLYPVAYVCNVVGWLMGTKLKLNPFNVRVLTMHRWFNISAAERDLKYQPIIPFEAGMIDTTEWFKVNWLPGFSTSGRSVGIAQQSEAKINVQAAGTDRK